MGDGRTSCRDLATLRDAIGSTDHPTRGPPWLWQIGDRVIASQPHPGSESNIVSATKGLLEVTDLAFAYPDGRQVLYGVNFTVTPGERVAILGPNGAGKTTLVLHLNGTLSAGAGSVRVDGVTVEKSTLRDIRRRVGIVFQDPDDQLFMPTVRDDVAFGPTNLGYRGDQLRQKVDAALDAVGMAGHADRAPHHLSFGQRRRVAASTVLSMDPTVLVLDEPSSNLDPMARREFAEIVLTLGLTTVIVTHDLLYALQLCPRSVIMDAGRIVADGPTRQILGDADLLASHRLELPVGAVVQE